MEARQPVRRRARQPTRRRADKLPDVGPDKLPDVGPDNPDNLQLISLDLEQSVGSIWFVRCRSIALDHATRTNHTLPTDCSKSSEINCTRRRGEGRRACRVRSSGMSGPIVGHVGPDRRACRARSSGMSGPIVGHVGPDRRACRARRARLRAIVGSSAVRNCPSRLP